MPPLRNQTLPDYRLIASWVGAIGLLWLLLLWNSVGCSETLYRYQLPQSVATSDAHAYATGEHQFSPRRILNVFSSFPPSDSLTPLIGALCFFALVIFLPLKAALVFRSDISPFVYPFQLITLNISRAPPSFH